MKSAPSKPLTGPLRYAMAVSCASIDFCCSAALWGLMLHVDFDTWEAFPAVERIAFNAKVGVTTVRAGLRSLRKLGVVIDVRKSKGGRGDTNTIRVDLDTLEALNPALGAGFPKERTEKKPRARRSETLRQALENPAPGAAEHTNEQTREQTTITTCVPQAPATTNRPVGGGDGGGASPLAVGSEKTAERGHCPQESERLLVDLGVSKRKATTLAAVYPPPVVDAGMAWVKAHAPDAASPAGRLVSILEDGTAAEYRLKLDRERARREEEERRTAETARLVNVAGLISKLLHRVGEGISDKSQQKTYDLGMAVIREAWPAPLDAARSGVLSEGDLTDPAAKPNALFNRLVRAAKAEVKARGSPPAEEPRSPIEGTTGGAP